MFSPYERVLIVPGLSSAYGYNRALEALHFGKTVCFAPFGPPMLWLVNTYDIDLIICSPQQALALADIQEKVTRYPLPVAEDAEDRRLRHYPRRHRAYQAPPVPQHRHLICLDRSRHGGDGAL